MLKGVESKSARSAFKREFQERLITYTVDVLNVCAQLRKDGNLWELASQLARSSGSIGANFFEAQGASSRKDYANFFQMAEVGERNDLLANCGATLQTRQRDN